MENGVFLSEPDVKERGMCMYKLILLIMIVFSVGLGTILVAQDANQRTRELVASLDKTKYKKKEKANVSVEVYVDVKNTPATKASPAEYSGTYDADGYRLQLEVSADGSAKGAGFDTLIDGGRTFNFTLKNAHVDGALLTATKVYDSGGENSFEAVFVDRTSQSGKNPQSVTTTETKFGIGFIQSAEGNQNWSSRVFLEKR
jgi:hypothetical protein